MQKRSLLLSAVVLLVVVISGLFIFGIIGSPSDRLEGTEEMVMEKTEEKLVIEDIEEGNGDAVEPGDEVVIHYAGTLTDGTKFDSSYDRGEPFQTQIGTGQVIEGWDKGVVGMKAGGKRKLVIPASMAYGDADIPGIPPNSTLIFEVELLEVLK